MRSTATPRLAMGCLVAGLVLGGCGEGPETAAPTQVVARVGEREITAFQLDEELARLGTAEGAPTGLRSQVLQALVDRELLAQAALDEGLDRDPAVLSALERSRAQTLAQALLERELATGAPPTEADVRRRYAEQPDRYAERRVVRLRQLSFPAERLTSELKRDLDAAGSLDAATALLRARSVPTQPAAGLYAPEELPAALARDLASFSPGKIFILQAPGQARLVEFSGAVEQPLSLDEARPAIRQALASEARKRATEAKLQELRSQTRVEVVGGPRPGARPAGADYLEKGLSDLD